MSLLFAKAIKELQTMSPQDDNEEFTSANGFFPFLPAPRIGGIEPKPHSIDWGNSTPKPGGVDDQSDDFDAVGWPDGEE